MDREDYKMRKIIRVFVVILIAYLIYAFISTVIIYAFKNPNARERLEPFSAKLGSEERKNKDRVQLIESAEDGVRVRKELIEGAKESIDISYFTFRDGEIGQMMLGGVLEAADRGVEVRVLLDSLSFLASLTGEFKDLIYGLDSHENIDFKFYDPVNPLFPFNWNKRLHDKMILIDDNLALIGGRNIADNYYMDDVKWKTFSKDRDVLIFKDQSEGDYYSVIEDMKNYYNDTWNYEYSRSFIKKLNSREKTKSDLACENLKDKYIEIKYSFKEKPYKINWYEITMPVENIEFVHNPVGKINQDPWCLREILFLSSQAEESIFMQSPYIIPTRRIEAIYNQYDIDLKKTTMLTNSYYSSPNHLSISAYSNYREEMVDSGVSIYEYQGEGSLHAKTYIFDDYISAIGSFNLDARSSYINSETMVVIFSEDFAEKLKKNVQLDLDKSLELADDYSYIEDGDIEKGEISRLKRISVAILSKITPLLEHIL